MNIRVILEYDELTKSFAVYCPELPGCTSAGDTEDEALTNNKEAIEPYLLPVEIPLKDKKVVELVI